VTDSVAFAVGRGRVRPPHAPWHWPYFSTCVVVTAFRRQGGCGENAEVRAWLHANVSLPDGMCTDQSPGTIDLLLRLCGNDGPLPAGDEQHLITAMSVHLVTAPPGLKLTMPRLEVVAGFGREQRSAASTGPPVKQGGVHGFELGSRWVCAPSFEHSPHAPFSLTFFWMLGGGSGRARPRSRTRSATARPGMIAKTLRIWGCRFISATTPPAAFMAFLAARTTRNGPRWLT